MIFAADKILCIYSIVLFDGEKELLMALFGVDIAGRVRNYKLGKKKVLFPIFEAVVNSIQAIEDRIRLYDDIEKGNIDISIKRNTVLNLEDHALGDISEITVKDNGIGFNNENIESFLQSDSTYKESRGGKGVGRFCWLKVFSNVHIESTYLEGDELYRRVFDFNLDIRDLDDKVTESSDPCGTSVTLSGIKKDYEKAFPLDVYQIVYALVNHCAVYFFMPDCPDIYIHDDRETIYLNQVFKDLFSDHGNEYKFEIKERTFCLNSLQMPIENSSKIEIDTTNRVMLCANNRAVEDFKIDKYLNGLGAIIKRDHKFYYLGILTSDYLDEVVDANRLSFSFPDSGSLFDIDNPSKNDIEDAIIETVRKFLHSYEEQAQFDRKQLVDDYISSEAPQYKPVLKHLPNVIESIKFGSDQEMVEDALYHGKRKLEKDFKNKSDDLLSSLEDGASSSDEYIAEFKKQVDLFIDINMSSLAEYVAKRKAVLNIFDRGLRILRTNKYNKESFLHELIFPLRKTSDDISYDAHNLWLIDERLTYATYLASDISLGKDADNKRPDILALSGPVLVADEENTGREFNSISIFELKRPMRDDYSIQENPIDQLLTYVEKIQENKALDVNGRPIRVNDSTMIYLYAVCDVTPSLKSLLRRKDFNKMADGLGWFNYYSSYNAYIEILPFDKIVNDAKMRNRIFFEKLGLE